MSMERDGEILYLVLASDVSEQAAEGLTRLLQHAIDNGWTQNWPGDMPGQQ